MKKITKGILGLSAITIAMLSSAPAYASGYKLEFQDPAVLADAGEAAVINDASTNWYNSAGLVYLPQQLVWGATAIDERSKVTAKATAPNVVSPLLPTYTAQGSNTSINNSLLPDFHYSLPFKNRYAFGLSIVPAWGLAEDYGQNSIFRYNLTKISTKTIDVAPSLAMKINDSWSVGAGPDFHYFSVTSRNSVNTLFITPTDSVSRYTANNWGRGWHAGILFRLDNATRIGLNYRSKIVMNLTGSSDFALSGIMGYGNNNFKVSIPMPPTTTLSIYHDMTPTWALMGTIAYDQWSVIKYYYGQNFQGVGVTQNVTLPQNMSNTIDLSVGTHYKLNEQWMLRGSFKYEPTPTANNARYISFPDGPKYGVNLGARYTVNKAVAIDMVYAHVFTSSEHINDVNPVTGATVNGHVNTNIDLFGAQLVWSI